MRIILVLWAIPIILFWGWYGLSANDWNFGFFFLERGFHDVVFGLYSQILGLPAEEIPAMLAWVFFIDTLIVFGIAALRWYKLWLPQSVAWIKEKTGLAEEERAYVRDIYQPAAAHDDAEINPVQAGQASPAK